MRYFNTESKKRIENKVRAEKTFFQIWQSLKPTGNMNDLMALKILNRKIHNPNTGKMYAEIANKKYSSIKELEEDLRTLSKDLCICCTNVIF